MAKNPPSAFECHTNQPITTTNDTQREEIFCQSANDSWGKGWLLNECHANKVPQPHNFEKTCLILAPLLHSPLKVTLRLVYVCLFLNNKQLKTTISQHFFKRYFPFRSPPTSFSACAWLFSVSECNNNKQNKSLPWRCAPWEKRRRRQSACTHPLLHLIFFV